MIPSTNRTKQQNFFLIFILGLLDTIGPFSIEMYLPAFPEIASDLHTTVQNVSLSVSTYFLGFAAGQILYGPLLDRFGRKRPGELSKTVVFFSAIAFKFSGKCGKSLAQRI
jgi:DHA1 family bicyclomycin/chloramphenicol resistance-like MFS transporter